MKLKYSNNIMSNWTLRQGKSSVECSSFPFAFRTAYNAVRKAFEEKKNPLTVANDITILGPITPRGVRSTYNYADAKKLATEQGLLTPDGNINSKEFKRR